MILRVREAVTATARAAVILLCAGIVLVTVQLSARVLQAAIWLVDGVGVAAWWLDAAVRFAMQVAEFCAASAVQFTIGMANWTIIRIDRLAGMVFLLPLSVGQLAAAFEFTLSGPAAITVLFIAIMVFVRFLTPRVGEFLNDVLSVPLSVGGIAYAVMQARRR